MADIDLLSEQIKLLKAKLQFKHWLYMNGLKEFEAILNDLNILTLNDVLVHINKLKSMPEFTLGYSAFILLQLDHKDIESYPVMCDVLPYVSYFWTLLVFAGKFIMDIFIFL